MSSRNKNDEGDYADDLLLLEEQRRAERQVEYFMRRFGFDGDDPAKIGREVRELLEAHRWWKKVRSWFWGGFFGVVAMSAWHYLEIGIEAFLKLLFGKK